MKIPQVMEVELHGGSIHQIERFFKQHELERTGF
jgi:hypothetical protein